MENFREKQVERAVQDLFRRRHTHGLEQYVGVAYHYTNSDGISGIVKNKQLWLTDVLHLNDRSEIIYSINIIKDILRRGIEKFTDQRDIKLYKVLLDGIDSSFSSFAYYSTSLSREGDKLSQWRAYANDGSGFSIGLKIREDAYGEPLDDLRQNVFVGKIKYDDKEFSEKQMLYLETVREIIRNDNILSLLNTNDDIRFASVSLCTELSSKWISDAIFHKHSAFSEEEEIRILLVNEKRKLDQYVGVRSARGRLVPYIPYTFEADLMVAEIVIGPAAHEDSEAALDSLIKSAGLSNVNLRRSDIPYRRWGG